MMRWRNSGTRIRSLVDPVLPGSSMFPIFQWWRHSLIVPLVSSWVLCYTLSPWVSLLHRVTSPVTWRRSRISRCHRRFYSRQSPSWLSLSSTTTRMAFVICRGTWVKVLRWRPNTRLAGQLLAPPLPSLPCWHHSLTSNSCDTLTRVASR